MEEDIVLREAPRACEGLGAEDEVAVAEHSALRPAGGAARVEDRCRIIEAASDVLERLVLAEKGLADRAEARHGPATRDGGIFVCIVSDDERGLCVVEEPGDLGAGVRRIERQIHGANPRAGDVQGEELG
ncbi:unannotated protein [freshwater metagenome]|uniref:Unannotated protein n=1 Tax=freshwater metagenome TaxID=449393 RepID=A0A6J6TNS9_9ZZZZ